jgi:DNA polymerase elongation subunit (family B)
MGIVVLDIETLGSFRQEDAAAIEEMAAKRELSAEEFVALSAPLAHVVCVGLLHLESGVARAIYDASVFPVEAVRGEDAEPQPDEGSVLAKVNEVIQKPGVTRIVTFNGRGFDLPVLIHRSVALGVGVAEKLARAAREYRYKPNLHIDLYDQFTFFGAVRGGTLRSYAIGYGLADPKAAGAGDHVGELVRQGDAAGLTGYCLGDVRTTGQLYRRWAEAVGVAA